MTLRMTIITLGMAIALGPIGTQTDLASDKLVEIREILWAHHVAAVCNIAAALAIAIFLFSSAIRDVYRDI